jgi:Uma2 family endonuclease
MGSAKALDYYTYNDYLSWDDTERYELIDGVPFAMSAPSQKHQRVAGGLFSQLWNYLNGKPCQVFYAPFDVRLNAEGNDDTVVQPDILVVCDSKKLGERSCDGAPDMVVEVLSPSTAQFDIVRKFKLYRKYGVREYWIVDPESKTVNIYLLKDGVYVADSYMEEDAQIPVKVLEGCLINLQDVFT